MVKISKFFGGGKNKTGKAVSHPAEPVQERKVVTDHAPVCRGSDTRATDAEAWYCAAVQTFKKYHNTALNGTDLIDRHLIDTVKDMARLVASDDSKLFFCTEKTTVDSTLYSHAVNTTIIALTLGRGLGYDTAVLNVMGLAALVHHVGLFGSLNLVSKKSTLSADEIRNMRDNKDSSVEIVRPLCVNKDSLEILISKISAQCFGRETAGISSDKRMPEYAEVIQLAVLFELLTHSKPNEERLIPHDACKWFIAHWQQLHGDAPFSSKLVKAMIDSIGLYPIGSYVILSTGELARIIHVEKGSPVRPVVEVLLSSRGDRIKEKRIITLKDAPLISITEAVDENLLKVRDKKFLLSLKVRRWLTR